MRGNTAKYLALLGRFVDAHAADMARLQACLAQGDHATAQRLAHTLRGTAATLGADQLASMTQRLESALRAPPAAAASDLDAAIASVDEQLAALAAIFSGRTSRPTPTANAAAASETITPKLLDQLDDLLTHHDAEAITLITDHEAALLAALGPRGEQLAREVRQFDFASALQTLREARHTSGE